MRGEDARTLSFRGRRSRNKVSVGEPAEGSFACSVKLNFDSNVLVSVTSPRFLVDLC